MTKPLPVPTAPAPLEAYAQQVDALCATRKQPDAFRRYVEGFLLPAERNTTVTALATTAPLVGAHHPDAQHFQWFCSESPWDPHVVNAHRLALLRAAPQTAPTVWGALVIDERGARQAGTRTAHGGRHDLATLGKIDNGVVSGSSRWADAQLYYPLAVEPSTPAHHVVRGKHDPAFRTTPQIARQLVRQALAGSLPLRAVVADCFYGEHQEFMGGLQALQVG